MADGKVSDATRIERVAPTITELSDKGAKVILLAHFGRPKGGPDPEFSLKPIAAATAAVIGRPVRFAEDCIGEAAAAAVAELGDGEVLLLENTRFHKGEEKNDPGLRRSTCRQWRDLRQRCVLGRPSRACLDRGPGPQPARLCRAHHAGRTRGAGKGPRQPETSGGGDRRRRQGLDQDRPAHEPGETGGCAGHRRRHGQHLPRRARHAGRQVAVPSTTSPTRPSRS